MGQYPPVGMYGKAYPPPKRPADKHVWIEQRTLTDGKVVPRHQIWYYKDGKLTIDAVAECVRSFFALNDDVGIRMTAICMAESSGDPLIEGGPNGNGSYDYGLCQINDQHYRSGKLSPIAWYDPGVSLGNAAKLGNKGAARGITSLDQFAWENWSVYNSGAYETHLEDAKRAWTGTGGAMDRGEVIEEGLPQVVGSVFDELLKSLGLGSISSVLWIAGGCIVGALGILVIVKGQNR